MGPARSRKESVMPTKKPDVYPPLIIDPLLPGGIPSTSDGTEKPAPDPDAAAHDAWPGGLASFSGDLASFSKLVKGMAKTNDALEEIIRREGKYIGGGVYEITINGEIYRVRSCDPFRVRDVEAEAPCGACGRYTVNLGGVCPGCGAVR